MLMDPEVTLVDSMLSGSSHSSPSYSYSLSSQTTASSSMSAVSLSSAPSSGCRRSGKVPKVVKRLKKMIRENFDDNSLDYEEMVELFGMLKITETTNDSEDVRHFYSELEDVDNEEMSLDDFLGHLVDIFPRFKDYDKAEKRAGRLKKGSKVDARLVAFAVKESANRRRAKDLEEAALRAAAAAVAAASSQTHSSASSSSSSSPLLTAATTTTTTTTAAMAEESSMLMSMSMVSDDIVEEIMSMFEEIDEDGVGKVDDADFREAISEFIDDEHSYLGEETCSHLLFEYLMSLEGNRSQQELDSEDSEDSDSVDEIDYVQLVKRICSASMCQEPVVDATELVCKVLDKCLEKARSWKQEQMLGEVQKSLVAAGGDSRTGAVTFDQFFTAITDMTESTIEKRVAKQMFNLTTVNGETVQIDIFVERLAEPPPTRRGGDSAAHERQHSTSHSQEISSFIKGSFAEDIDDKPKKKKKKRRKHSKERKRKKSREDSSSGHGLVKEMPGLSKKTAGGSVDAMSMFQSGFGLGFAMDSDGEEHASVTGTRDSHHFLVRVFQEQDENKDEKIDYEEFRAAVTQVTRELEDEETRQIYLHSQQLLQDWELDLNDFLVHLKEEHMSFPESNPRDLLFRLFLKTITEASAVDRFNQLLLDHVSPAEGFEFELSPIVGHQSSVKVSEMPVGGEGLDAMTASHFSESDILDPTVTPPLFARDFPSPGSSPEKENELLSARILHGLSPPTPPVSGDTLSTLHALARMSGSGRDLLGRGSLTSTPIPSFAEIKSDKFEQLTPRRTGDIHRKSRLSALRLGAFPSVAASSPLLRRIHKPELRSYIEAHIGALRAISQEKFLAFVRAIKPDTALGTKELSVIYDEWKLCVARPSFKFRDLVEFDFLLFHLGLVINRGLKNKLLIKELTALREDGEQSPTAKAPTPERTDSSSALPEHAPRPSFMDSEALTSQLALLKQELFSTVEPRQRLASQFVTRGEVATETLRTRTHPAFTPVKFTLADLCGEFVDENDNFIKISRVETVDTPSITSPRVTDSAGSMFSTPSLPGFGSSSGSKPSPLQLGLLTDGSAMSGPKTLPSPASPGAHTEARRRSMREPLRQALCGFGTAMDGTHSPLGLVASKSTSVSGTSDMILESDESLVSSSSDEDSDEGLTKTKSVPTVFTSPIPQRDRRGGSRGAALTPGGVLDIDGVNSMQTSAARHWIRESLLSPEPLPEPLVRSSTTVTVTDSMLAFDGFPDPKKGIMRSESDSLQHLAAMTSSAPRHRLRPSKSFSDLLEMVKDTPEFKERQAKAEIAKRKTTLSPLVTASTALKGVVNPLSPTKKGLKKKGSSSISRSQSEYGTKSSLCVPTRLEQSETIPDEVSPSAPSDFEVSNYGSDEDEFLTSDSEAEGEDEKMPPLFSSATTDARGEMKALGLAATAKAVEKKRREMQRRKSNEFYATLKADGSGGFEQMDLDISEASRTTKKLAFDPSQHTAHYDPESCTIVWSNGSRWMRKDFTPFMGRWRDPHGHVVQINEVGTIAYIEPSELGAYAAAICGFYKLIVTFQSFTYHCELVDTSTLEWDNGSVWNRVEKEPAAVPADCLIM